MRAGVYTRRCTCARVYVKYRDYLSQIDNPYAGLSRANSFAGSSQPIGYLCEPRGETFADRLTIIWRNDISPVRKSRNGNWICKCVRGMRERRYIYIYKYYRRANELQTKNKHTFRYIGFDYDNEPADLRC